MWAFTLMQDTQCHTIWLIPYLMILEYIWRYPLSKTSVTDVYIHDTSSKSITDFQRKIQFLTEISSINLLTVFSRWLQFGHILPKVICCCWNGFFCCLRLERWCHCIQGSFTDYKYGSTRSGNCHRGRPKIFNDGASLLLHAAFNNWFLSIVYHLL